MRLSLALLLPAVAGVARATTASIQGIVFGRDISVPPNREARDRVLTPRQFRLVLAGQLDLSQYHALTDESNTIDSSTIEAINALVGRPERLVHGESAAPDIGHLTIFRGNTKEIEDFKSLLGHVAAQGYPFSLAESSVRLEDLNRLIEDFKIQAATSDSSDVYDLDLSDPSIREKILDVPHRHGNNMRTLLLINTDENKKTSAPANAFGTYTMPNTASNKRKSESPLSESFLESSGPATPQRDEKAAHPLRKLPALCYNTLEACTNATNNCSGHGECYRKYGPEKEASGAECFACGCIASFEKNKTTYWGGAACQKEDVSSQFWILAGFSVLLMGLVGWAIGMMFSIGNEKLPGVIGAGVAPKTR